MKKRFVSFLLTVCVMILAMLGLTACDNTPAPNAPQKLTTPVVVLTDNVATWDADTNADKFELSLDGNLSYVENTITSKTLMDGETLKVRAVGNSSTYSTSDWSNTVTYVANGTTPQPTKLDTPIVTISNTGLATWTAVTNANGYVYKLNGGTETLTSSTSVQLTDGQSVVVKAVGDGTSYADSDYSVVQMYTAGTVSTTGAPTYLGITASTEEPTANGAPFALCSFASYATRSITVEELLGNYYSNSDHSLGQSMPSASTYEVYSSNGNVVYIQIWLENPDQNTILSLKLNGTKYQSGGALQSFFLEDGDSYLNCVYVAIILPTDVYGEIPYEVTEIEYVEGTDIHQNGKAVLIDEEKDTVKIGLSYKNYPYATCGALEVGCHNVSVAVSVEDQSNLMATKGYWMRAVLLEQNGVVSQTLLSGNAQADVRFDSLMEETEYTFVVFYLGDRNDGEGLTYNIVYSESFTTDAVVTVEEFLLGAELVAENGKNGAKITVCATISYDANAFFDRVELYDGETLVLTDDEFEGFDEYDNLNSKTEYLVKMYYSSDEHGYTDRVKEIRVTTPAYELPDVDGYGSDKNVVVGKHAIYNFNIEKYVDLKYYDVIVRGYVQNDAYFAPFIVEMLENPNLLAELEQRANDRYVSADGYVWEAQYYMDEYLAYLQAWEHKEYAGYADSKWREIASSNRQYVYELSVENEGLFLANDGDFVYNYYAVLRDYFTYEDLRFEIYLSVDLGDGEGVREINAYTAYPYFREISDDNYGYSIEEDADVKNGYVFTETHDDYKALYVYKLALYQNGEFVCYVPFTSTDTTSIDMEAWLQEWIEKLQCEIPNATEQEMVAKVGAERIGQIFNELQFYEEGGFDGVVDGNGNVSTGGSGKGNVQERELLTAIGAFDGEALLTIFKAQTQENKTLIAFIEDSDNGVIIDVITAYRTQTQVTSQNAYALYSAINGVYNVSGQLKNEYENCVREENANKIIVDRLEAIQAVSFKFVAGTDLAPAGDYELRILFRSLLANYEGEEAETYEHSIRIKRDLQAPTNVKVSEDGRYITWDAVDGADEYDIYVNGEKRFDAWSNSYEQYGELNDGDEIQVMAIGNYAYDSELSTKCTFVQPKLSKPTVTVSGSNVWWEHVENASKYVYTVNGQEYETWGTSINVYKNATVRVKAVDENGAYLDSDWVSVTVEYGSADKEK